MADVDPCVDSPRVPHAGTRVRRPRSSPWPLQPRASSPGIRMKIRMNPTTRKIFAVDLCIFEALRSPGRRATAIVTSGRGSKAPKAKHEGGVQSHVWGGVTAGLLVHNDLARRCSCVKENKGYTPRQDERERRPAGCHHLWRAIGRGVALQHERCAGCGGLCGDRGLEGNRGRED